MGILVGVLFGIAGVIFGLGGFLVANISAGTYWTCSLLCFIIVGMVIVNAELQEIKQTLSRK